MLAAFLAPVDLGDDYQIENQGLAGILAGLAFFGYIAFNAIADANDTGGIVSATARLIGIFFAVAIIIAITFTFPKSMKCPKLLMAALCILGVIMQFNGVSELMKPIAETWSMYGWLRFSNLCFMGVLIVFAYCLARHPHLPTWIGPSLMVVTPIWMTYYSQVKVGEPQVLLSYIAWGPCLLLEFACSIAFIVASSGMLTEARKRVAHSHGF
ncbi:hypothetical protein [Corynebacterium sp. H130]|uniref:hypothetical protein n=1 Tax=Corynebacterium sp. H130 TaxID=3133444 RepID=UPI0030B57E22